MTFFLCVKKRKENSVRKFSVKKIRTNAERTNLSIFKVLSIIIVSHAKYFCKCFSQLRVANIRLNSTAFVYFRLAFSDIIPFTMQVYIELAVLENFCMDFTLLYAAKAAVKNPSPFWRILIAAVLGAAFAVTFPLLNLGAVWAVAVKVLSGFLICLAAGKFKGIKSYLKFSFAFLAFTALLGGALIGIFSLVGLDFAAGQGFILSKIPIGIPLFGALLLIIGAKKLASRLKKSSKEVVTVRLYAGGGYAEIKGFFDSGNKVYLHGAPVSIIPKDAAAKIVDESRIKDGVKIHTVAGSKIIKIFTADKVEIDFGEKKNNYKGVKIGISPQRISRAVLHPDLLEDVNV